MESETPQATPTGDQPVAMEATEDQTAVKEEPPAAVKEEEERAPAAVKEEPVDEPMDVSVEPAAAPPPPVKTEPTEVDGVQAAAAEKDEAQDQAEDHRPQQLGLERDESTSDSKVDDLIINFGAAAADESAPPPPPPQNELTVDEPVVEPMEEGAKEQEEEEEEEEEALRPSEEAQEGRREEVKEEEKEEEEREEARAISDELDDELVSRIEGPAAAEPAFGGHLELTSEKVAPAPSVAAPAAKIKINLFRKVNPVAAAPATPPAAVASSSPAGSPLPPKSPAEAAPMAAPAEAGAAPAEEEEEEVPLIPAPPDDAALANKPRLRGRKLTVLPPKSRGNELSGLCSIM